MTDVFDNASSITIGNKEVASIKIGTASIYEKVVETGSSIIITFDYNENSSGVLTSSEVADPILYTGDSLTINYGNGITETYTGGEISVHSQEYGIYTITIIGDITGFDPYAFSERQGMTSITIPDTITSLDGGEFYGVDTLTSIKFTSSTPPSISNGIIGVSNLATIYVPTGSLSAYQNAQNYPTQNVTYVEY